MLLEEQANLTALANFECSDRRASVKEYSRSVFQRAIAKICKHSGFIRIQAAALILLTDILEAFLEKVGKLSSENALLVGRSQCNALDINLALESLGFKKDDWEKLFDETISEFDTNAITFPLTVKKEESHLLIRKIISHSQPPPSCKDLFLPPFPPDHSYKNSPVYNPIVIGGKSTRIRKAEQIQQIQQSFAKFLINSRHSSSLPLRVTIKEMDLQLDYAVLPIKESYVASLASHHAMDATELNLEELKQSHVFMNDESKKN
ncbi:uncharacterized protein LOC135120810 [Zophobas morio]|jgi:histone H3/H4|uniref:uncharacterized protein LOC135120810 n=1 Tax=Zophobas morio TaxID=2755281 RepID=UPI00308295D8